ncbi:hypothetical protein ACRAWD_08645 [Caulobacter segnis]
MFIGCRPVRMYPPTRLGPADIDGSRHRHRARRSVRRRSLDLRQRGQLDPRTAPRRRPRWR